MTASERAREVVEEAEAAARAKMALAVAARTDTAVFAEFILRDEKDGRPIESQELHYSWHDEISGHDRVVLLTSVETGKSQQLTIALPLFDLGQDPRHRILIVSKRKEMAKKFTSSIRNIITSSEELKMVFPELRPSDNGQWQADAFVVHRPGKGSPKDYSVEAAGLDANKLGSRYTRIYIDDLLDFNGTWTDYQRKKTLTWLESTLFGRLAPGGKIVFIGNPWHEEDAAHILGRRKGWKMIRAGVVKDDIDANTFLGMSQAEREKLHYTWKSRWGPERILKFIQDFGETEANRQVFAKTPKAGSKLFNEKWVQVCMARGVGKSLRSCLLADEVPDGAFVSIGVDLASRKGKKNDSTAFFVFLVHPPSDSSKQPHGDLELLWLERAKMGSPEIKNRIVELHSMFPEAVFTVEDIGAQIYITQDLCVEHPEITTRNFTTNMANKWGMENGFGGLNAQFEAARVIIPSQKTTVQYGNGEKIVSAEDSYDIEPIIRAWIQEVKNVSKDEHTGDLAMASLFARDGAKHPPFQHAWAVTFSGNKESGQGRRLDEAKWVPDAWRTLTPSAERVAVIMSSASPKTGKEADMDAEIADRFGFDVDADGRPIV